jgi:hypothetical protein
MQPNATGKGHLRADLASWTGRATLIGLAVVAVGFGAVLAAAIQGMQLAPELSLVDGYWVGLLPWMAVGTWLIPLGALLTAAAGTATVMTSRSSLLGRLLSIAALAVVLFWALITVMHMAPRNAPDGSTSSSDLATVVYSLPETTAVLLLLPAALIATLALVVGRRAS